jgi:hypothetical protein
MRLARPPGLSLRAALGLVCLLGIGPAYGQGHQRTLDPALLGTWRLVRMYGGAIDTTGQAGRGEVRITFRPDNTATGFRKWNGVETVQAMTYWTSGEALHITDASGHAEPSRYVVDGNRLDIEESTSVCVQEEGQEEVCAEEPSTGGRIGFRLRFRRVAGPDDD